MVEAKGLTKTYPARNGAPPFRAVDGINFEFERGEVFGFLGPNGAGKSSTMRMLGATSPVMPARSACSAWIPPTMAPRSGRGLASCRRMTASTVS